MNLALNEETHEYALDGCRMDGLTSTISEGGLIRGGDPWYMNRGTAIHKATEFYDKGTLDDSTVVPEIQGYLESWKRFELDQDYAPEEIEYRTYHPILCVGMTIDRLPGPIDLKSGGPEPWHILQIAVQWDALKQRGQGFLADRPMDVYLDPDGGPPKIKLYKTSEMREAFKVYASMLYFLRWRREKYGNSNRNT